MSDLAAFKQEHVQAVYGCRPRCFVTLLHQWVDAHHILGRGGKRNRKLHSSILNFAPLQRDVHNGPVRDHPLMRAMFLMIARKHVMQAVGRGIYELNDNDLRFIEHADVWVNENVPLLSTMLYE